MIEIVDLYKSFGNEPVLKGINLEIETGETIVIIGRSGCGKSVLIKNIVGLLSPDSGYVKLEGKIVASASPADRVLAVMLTPNHSAAARLIRLDVALLLMVMRGIL